MYHCSVIVLESSMAANANVDWSCISTGIWSESKWRRLMKFCAITDVTLLYTNVISFSTLPYLPRATGLKTFRRLLIHM